MAVETQPVYRAAGTERQGVARLVHNAGKGVGAGDSGKAVFRTMATMDQVGEIPLKEKELERSL